MKDHIILLDALTDVDDDLIAQAETIRPKHTWKAWVAAAAAVAVIIGAAFHLPHQSDTPSANLCVQNFITLHASPYEQGYVGNPYNEKAPNNSYAMVAGPTEMYLTARVVEVLPDTYRTVRQQSGGFRLIRMKYIHGLNVAYSGRYFYCMVSNEYAATLKVFSTVVLAGMTQYGHSDHILYNITQECLSTIDYPVIGGSKIFAFRDDLLDYSLPGTEEYMEQQSKYAEYGLRHLSKTPTLEEFERYICGRVYGKVRETIYDHAKSDDPEIIDALDYVRPFENGIFIPIIDIPYWQYNNGEVLYRRYVNGYPTNEAIEISSIGVKYYGPKFTEEDLKDLPDLTAALEKVTQDFDAGLITPGHIENWEEMKFISHSIFAWYDKTDDGVYGVIRVSWCYHRYRENIGLDVFRDDQYFLVELGSDTLRPIEHDELLEMGGGAYHFMPGQYGYDKYGRKDPPYTVFY